MPNISNHIKNFLHCPICNSMLTIEVLNSHLNYKCNIEQFPANNNTKYHYFDFLLVLKEDRKIPSYLEYQDSDVFISWEFLPRKEILIGTPAPDSDYLPKCIKYPWIDPDFDNLNKQIKDIFSKYKKLSFLK